MQTFDYSTLRKSLGIFGCGAKSPLIQGVYYGVHNSTGIPVFVTSLCKKKIPQSLDEIDNLFWTESPRSTIDHAVDCRTTVSDNTGGVYTLFISSQVNKPRLLFASELTMFPDAIPASQQSR